MYKAILFLFIALLSFACNQTPQTKKGPPTINEPSIDHPNKETDKEAPIKNDSPINILMPTFYRIIDGINPTKKLNKNWLDLFELDGDFFMEQTKHSIKKGIDECTGDKLRIISTNRNTILLIDFPTLSIGKVNASIINDSELLPNKSLELLFNETKFTFRSEGIQSDSGIENFKLFIKTKQGKDELLLKMEELEDTVVNLLFAGDIDRDGKLDIILDAPRHYEEKRMLLFLSSKAKNGNLLQKVAEIRSGFDC